MMNRFARITSALGTGALVVGLGVLAAPSAHARSAANTLAASGFASTIALNNCSAWLVRYRVRWTPTEH
jgi:hypothetical protein